MEFPMYRLLKGALLLFTGTRTLVLLTQIAGLLIATNVSASAGVAQRMRIPVGEYWVGGGGGSGGGGSSEHRGSGSRSGATGGGTGSSAALPSGPAASNSPSQSLPIVLRPSLKRTARWSLPAYCIDWVRDQPENDLPSASGNIKVFRYKDGVQVGERSLIKAMDREDPWLSLKGNGSASSIDVMPVSADFDYRIVVSGLAIVGESEADVAAAFRDWNSNEQLVNVSQAFDDIRHLLVAGKTLNSHELERLELARRDIEWKQFGESGSGANISGSKTDPAFIASTIRSEILSDKGSTLSGLAERITLARGAVLSPDEVNRLKSRASHLGFAPELSSAPVANNAGLLLAYSKAAAAGVVNFGAVESKRKEEKLSLDDSLVRATFNTGDEFMWTTGRPSLYALQTPSCSRAASQVAPLGELMRAVGGYNDVPIESGFVGFSSDFFGGCVITMDKDGSPRIDRLERNQVTPAYLSAKYGEAKIVAMTRLSENVLQRAGVNYRRFQEYARSLAAASLNRMETSAQTEFVHFSRQGKAGAGLDVTALNLKTKKKHTRYLVIF